MTTLKLSKDDEMVEIYSDRTNRTNPKLLVIAFFQEGYSNTYTFEHEAMFADLDKVCSWYDFTDETPDEDLVYTTYSEICSRIRSDWKGNDYFVTEDYMGNYAIYKFVKEVE